jgi:hypothetical protein
LQCRFIYSRGGHIGGEGGEGKGGTEGKTPPPLFEKILICKVFLAEKIYTLLNFGFHKKIQTPSLLFFK